MKLIIYNPILFCHDTSIQLTHIEPAKRMIPVYGTISILDLLRKIESHTGLYFKKHYTGVLNSQGNYVIWSKIELLRPAFSLPVFITDYDEYESRNQLPSTGKIDKYYYYHDNLIIEIFLHQCNILINFLFTSI